MSSRTLDKIKRLLSIMLIGILILEVYPEYGNLKKTAEAVEDTSASALEKDELNVLGKWEEQKESLGWINTEYSTYTSGKNKGNYKYDTLGNKIVSSETPSDSFWYNTGNDDTYWIDESKLTSRAVTTDDALGTRIEIAADKIGEDLLKKGESVSDYAYSETSSSDKLYYTIVRAEGYDAVNAKGTTTKEAYCRRYYVSTAAQLKAVFEAYQNENTTTGSETYKVRASVDEIKAAIEGQEVEHNTDYGITSATKVEVVLLCDIDLGGAEGYHWEGNYNTNIEMEIDGQGHYIYNGNYASNMYFLSYYKPKDDTAAKFYVDQKFAIHDVTFSNQFIGHNQGMFGTDVKYAYFNNVNWENCVATSTTTGNNGRSVTIVLGTNYLYCYFKNCTIRNSYAKASGGGHSAMFASYNNSTSCTGTYIENGSGSTYYYTTIPSLSEFELAFRNNQYSKETPGKKLSNKFPSIYEGCAVIDCSVYETDSSAFHSGIFVSCLQGNIIFRNCFASGSIYGNQQLGGFTGACIGSADGFEYKDPLTGETTKVNAVFEDCYASSQVEGKEKLGGFVGMIYNDARATGDSFLEPPVDIIYDNNKMSHSNNRGRVIFDNCYSTSSVGMEYSGDYIGGFVGVLRGNVRATAAADRKHLFLNCYAAGEVGGITINNSSDSENNATVGGFIGAYRAEDYLDENSNRYDSAMLRTSIEAYSTKAIENITVNCYYDKQTTAMRERSIGSTPVYTYSRKVSNGEEYNSSLLYEVAGTNDFEKNNKKFYSTETDEDKQDSIYTATGSLASLVGTLSGLTGVYTEASSIKSVQGLVYSADSELNSLCVDMGDDAAWSYKDGYYPQLSVFTDFDPAKDTLTTELYSELSLVEKMKYDRKVIYYYSAMASTSTVFLDHYDQILGTDGLLRNAESDTDDVLVYDTVCDITRKFQFTTDDSNNIQWEAENDEDSRNVASGFVDKLGETKTDTGGFKINYGAVVAEGSSDGSIALSHTFTPSVLTIEKDEGIYKCLNFAPGKQWVTVTATSSAVDRMKTTGAGETGTTDLSTAYITGTRQLRLLPTAYLDAGNIIHVNIISDDNDTTTTNVVYYSEGDSSIKLSTKFNHSIGVAYAITDRYRMGTTATYEAQKLSLLDTTQDNNSTDTFAFYSKYSANDSTKQNQLFDSVSLDTDNSVQSFSMIAQKFEVANAADYDYLQNSSTNGQTMVRVYKAKVTGDNVLERTKEVEYTEENIAKWSGTKDFDTTDTGYYYLDYYWRLDDGRYLTDSKLVSITADSYNVEMITGLLDEEFTLTKSELQNEDDVTFKYTTSIDQYVTDVQDVSNPSDKWRGVTSYPSDNEDFSDKTAAALYNTYNEKLTYNENLYYTKSIILTTNENTTEVGWRKSTDYTLSTLIIEAIDQYGETHQMARVDDVDSTTDLEFDNAEYVYNYTNYSITQDPNTKLFSVTTNDTVPVTFKITSETTNIGSDVEKYIVFSFTSGETDSSGTQKENYTSVKDSLRITALFRPNTADVIGEKTVLLKDEGVVDNGEEKTITKVTKTELAAEDEGNSEDDSTGLSDAEEAQYEIKYTQVACYTSLSSSQKKYEVDNSILDENDSEDDTKRKAVLSGDTLTYRVKLSNGGYFESGAVTAADVLPTGCTYVQDSMKIYRQQIYLEDNLDAYGSVETVAYFEDGKLQFGSYTDSTGTTQSYQSLYVSSDDLSAGSITTGNTAEVTTESTIAADSSIVNVMVQPNEANGNSMTWIIPAISLNYDYYIQYEVKVDELSTNQMKDILKNTATWEFLCHNGDVQSETAVYTLDDYMKSEIFDLNMIESEGDGNEVTYAIDFYRKYTDATYEDIVFTNEFPTGFTCDKTKGIKIYKLKTDGTIDSEIPIEVNDSDSINEQADNSTDASTQVSANTKITAKIYDNYFELQGLSITDETKYRVVFSGQQVKLGEVYKTQELTEIKNKASITYTMIITENDSDSNVKTSQSRKGNSIAHIERLSNEVTTDVTHMYFDIVKSIDANDPSQSFLYKVTYYETQEAYEAAMADNLTNASDSADASQTGASPGQDESDLHDGDSWYVRVNCTAKSPVSGIDMYTGDTIVQCDKRGIYVVTELCDWSGTDYDVAASTKLTQLIDFHSGTLTAIKTSEGTDFTNLTEVRYVNLQSDYAYLSGQAYAENTFK